MKAKTKLQQRAMAISQQLPPITPRQEAWGYERCLEHTGRKLKSGAITCMDCGHTWQDKGHDLLTRIDGCTCPACGRKLKVEETRRQRFGGKAYMMLATTHGGLQVLRFFLLEHDSKVGGKPYRCCREVVQHYITPDGRYTVVARLRAQSFVYNDLWTRGSDMEVRPLHEVHDINPVQVCPGSRYLPELRRNGFKGNFHRLTPLALFTMLLSNPKAETLLKAGQVDLLRRASYANYSEAELNAYWSSVKICLRNGYLVKDAGMWYDYLAMLRRAGKDLQSAKYVCPADLKREHDRLVDKEHRRERRERLARLKREAKEEEERYRRERKRFFGTEFSDGLITVAVLKSVQEFVEEGEAMRHCVFSSEYHKKPDSLILSARVNGERAETVEVSLSELEVVQSRGVNNGSTKYHKRIVELVNKNMKVIRRKAKSAA